MNLKPPTKFLIAAWLGVVGSYAAASLVLRPGGALTAFGDLMQCVASFVAAACLFTNARSRMWHRNAFWVLLALGTAMWMLGQVVWTYFEVVLKQPVPNPFIGDVVLFLHVVPMMAALALLPHTRTVDIQARIGYLDFALLILWWVYLYFYVVIPWQYVHSDVLLYGQGYNRLYLAENGIVIAGLAYLAVRAKISGAGGNKVWQRTYAHMGGAVLLFTAAAYGINMAIDRNAYHTGSLFDVPLVAAFLWLATAAVRARERSGEAEPEIAEAAPGHHWPMRLSVPAVLSIPVMCAWNLTGSRVPAEVRGFRLEVALGGMLLLTAIVLVRQNLMDRDRQRLLASAQESVENLQRIQLQLAQSEKLASLGQLAAGAAHEINNPLTAILGYSEVLAGDASTSARARELAGKIGEQARRTAKLVGHLLSFARQSPGERVLLDVGPILTGAIELGGLSLSDRKIRLEMNLEPGLPRVRGDKNQLLQVFYHIISNAVDAMEATGGGTLTVRGAREGDRVVLEFTDTGPGIREPHRAFDPFYTTKPVGKGTGLGLSICYGIVQEHGGEITCYNRLDQGATFRVELPAVNVGVPQFAPVEAAAK